ncbi:hypothetical protein [Streptomyces sp. NPDC127112]|uniref:hypothetical protein n=1 Tax=unclassified Streptomyces TaxID=2593676 RepID=UPI0036311E2F
MTSPINAPQQGSHHWILTLEMPGKQVLTDSGTVNPPAGATRYDMYLAIREHTVSGYPELSRANCVFFSLEPNQL